MEKKFILTLLITNKCNLDCYYCYEKNKNNEVMSFDIATKIIENHLDKSKHDYTSCLIEIFGGEPFLEFELIKNIFEWTINKHWDINYHFFVETNGTLLNAEIKEWLFINRDKITVSLSLDGNEEMQNINRSNSFSKIDLNFFKETYPQQGVQMTISDKTINTLAEGIFFLHSNNIKIAGCSFAQGLDWSDKKYTDIFKKQLILLADFYIQNDNLELFTLLDMKIENCAKTITNKNKWCGSGRTMITYDTNGNHYPCHLFAPLSSNRNGELNQIMKIEKEIITDNECLNCYLFTICPTCYGTNYNKFGNISIKDKSLCAFVKLRALASSKIKAERLLKTQKYKIAKNAEETYFLIEAIEKINNEYINL